MEQNTIDTLKQNAWIHACAEVAGLESSVAKAMKKDPTEDEARECYAQHIVPYVIANMMRTEAVCALAVHQGILPAEVVGTLMAATRSFCQAAANQRRAFCRTGQGTDTPCGWTGEVAEAGPVGVCPLCSKSPVAILDLTVPPSSNGRLHLLQ